MRLCWLSPRLEIVAPLGYAWPFLQWEHGMEADLQRRFGGIARLYGQEALQRFAAAKVCIIGVGGVGSWAVEALARSGIGQLTLIDLDNIAESKPIASCRRWTRTTAWPR